MPWFHRYDPINDRILARLIEDEETIVKAIKRGYVAVEQKMKNAIEVDAQGNLIEETT